MTPEQKRILEPFADTLANWDQQLREMTPDEFDAMEAACNAVTTTNCWAATYDAAHIIGKYIAQWRGFERRRARL